MKKQKSNQIVILAFILLLLVVFIYGILQLTKPPDIYRIELSEISNGVYAYRETVVSSIPAQNYTMTTVCDTDGNIYTIKGTVKVVNSDAIKPYAVWEDYNIVNSDEVTLYVPTGTVQYIGSSSVGRR